MSAKFSLALAIFMKIVLKKSSLACWFSSLLWNYLWSENGTEYDLSLNFRVYNHSWAKGLKPNSVFWPFFNVNSPLSIEESKYSYVISNLGLWQLQSFLFLGVQILVFDIRGASVINLWGFCVDDILGTLLSPMRMYKY